MFPFYNPPENARKPHKMVKHTQTIRRQQPTICLSVFDHCVRFSGVSKRHKMRTMTRNNLIKAYLYPQKLCYMHCYCFFVLQMKNRTISLTVSLLILILKYFEIFKNTERFFLSVNVFLFILKHFEIFIKYSE